MSTFPQNLLAAERTAREKGSLLLRERVSALDAAVAAQQRLQLELRELQVGFLCKQEPCVFLRLQLWFTYCSAGDAGSCMCGLSFPARPHQDSVAEREAAAEKARAELEEAARYVGWHVCWAVRHVALSGVPPVRRPARADTLTLVCVWPRVSCGVSQWTGPTSSS